MQRDRSVGRQALAVFLGCAGGLGFVMASLFLALRLAPENKMYSGIRMVSISAYSSLPCFCMLGLDEKRAAALL